MAEKHESGMAAIGTDQPVSKPKVRFTDLGKGQKSGSRKPDGRGSDDAKEPNTDLSDPEEKMGEIYQFVKAETMARDQERTSGNASSSWKGRDGSSNWKGMNVSPYPGRSTTSKESSAQQRGTDGGWGSRGQSPSPRRGPEGLRCYKCQGIGHMSRDCPSPCGWKFQRGVTLPPPEVRPVGHFQ